MDGSNRVMRCIVALAATLGMATASAAMAAEVITVAGAVTYVSDEVVEVAGHRGLIVPGTSISSEGREVSITSVRVGMPAELEVDASGRALDLRVKGAIE